MKSFRGLYRISLLLPIEPGQWKLQVKSDGHLTFNVLGTRVFQLLFSVFFKEPFIYLFAQILLTIF